MKSPSLLLGVLLGGAAGLILGSRVRQSPPSVTPQVWQSATIPAQPASLPTVLPGPADFQNLNFSHLLARDPAWACRLAVNAMAQFEESVAQWTARDPRAASNYVLALDIGPLRERGIGSVASSWASADPESAVRWFAGLTESDRVLAVRGLKDRAHLFSLAQSTTLFRLLPASLHHFWLSEVISSRFPQDLYSLIEWVEVPDNPSRGAAMRIFLPQWAEQDPVTAVRFLEEHSTDISFETRRRVALSWGRNDPMAALQWVENLSDNTERRVAMGTIIESYAQVAPEKAAALIANLPEVFQNDATETVLAQWAKISPPDAAVWLAQIPPGPVADRGVALVAKAWARSDPVAASAFLETLPPGIVRDKVIGEFTQDIDGYDVKAAVQWSLTIQDDTERERRFGNALARWLDTDRPVAEEWITESGLDQESLKNALRHAGR